MLLKRVKDILSILLGVRWIRKTFEGFTKGLTEFLGLSSLLVHFFYFLFPIAFWYEHSAAWRGRRDYYRQKYKHKKTSTGLRRNIHRLEKALIMKPRRPLFAEQYIEETVEFFAAAIERPAEEIDRMDREELEWAQDVLSEYFASIYGKSKRIDEARSKFMSIFVQRNAGSRKPGPKPHGAIPSFDSLLALSEQRRSVRWFDQRPVPRNLIDQAFLVARQSPSACNRLPYSFFVIDDSARVRHIASIPFGTAGFSDNIPTLIVVVGHLSQFFSTRDRHTIYIDSSLATMSFLLALETVGLASTIINWPEIPPLDYKIKKELGLLDSDRVIMMIAVGFTDTSCNVPYSAKKELDTFRLYLDKTISGE